MSQEDFFQEVERAVAEHRKMNLPVEIHEMEVDGKEHKHFKTALNELHKLSEDELAHRWAEVEKRNKKKK